MRMSFGLTGTLGTAVGLIAVTALATAAIVFLSLDALNLAADQRSHARRVMVELDAFRSAMLDQETGFRGYLITGRDENLEPYHWGAANLDAAIAALRPLLTRDTSQIAALDEAESSARDWQRNVAEPGLALMRDPATRERAADVEKSGEGLRSFDRFRARLAEIQGREEQQLRQSDVRFDDASRLARSAVVAGALISVLVCLGIGLAIRHAIARPLVRLKGVMSRLAGKELEVKVPYVRRRDEVGEMARAVQVFKQGLIEVERTSLLRGIADTVPAMIAYIDRERHIRFLNSTFDQWFNLHGRDVTRLTNDPVEAVFAEAPLPGYPSQFDRAMKGYPSRVDHRLAPHDGATRDVEIRYQPHRSPEGEIFGAVALITDISQRKELDRRLMIQARDLKRSNEELEQFAYIASHDLKAPLRGIDNLVTWIEEDLAEQLSGDTRTNMDLLHNRVQRLESLLNDLLDYSRAGRRAEAVERIDTRELVQELAGLVSPPEGFRIHVADDLPTIEAPRAPLTQIFQNLIGNAVKHHDRPAAGNIWVDARPNAEGTEYIVSDDGPGIPERFHERVFGMFQTLRPRDEVEGSGMGLAIVKKLIEAHGGSVSLRSRADRGLAVHFVWPTNPRGGAG
jgi:PAS domain S-box-containing protein